jgi:hypothetical protein
MEESFPLSRDSDVAGPGANECMLIDSDDNSLQMNNISPSIVKDILCSIEYAKKPFVKSLLMGFFTKGRGGKLDRKVSTSLLMRIYISVANAFDICQVYQIQGHHLKALKKSDAPPEEPSIPRLPRVDNQQQLKYDNSPRKKASSAFSSFASPSKKPRLDM